jgi:hypothetical protein
MYSDPVPTIDAKRVGQASREAVPIIPQNILEFILIIGLLLSLVDS